MAVGLADLLLSSMQEIRADLREIREEVGETKETVGEIKSSLAQLETFAEHLEKRLTEIEEGQSYSGPRKKQRTLVRDSGLTVSGATVALIVAAVLNHFWPTATPPAQPTRQPAPQAQSAEPK